MLSHWQHQAYWAGMASDAQQHCHQCNKCQMSKLPSPTQTPLQYVQIGNPWEMSQKFLSYLKMQEENILTTWQTPVSI